MSTTATTKQQLESLQDPLVWAIKTIWNPLSGLLSGLNLPTLPSSCCLCNKIKALIEKQLETSTKKELILTVAVIVLLVILLWGSLVEFINRVRKITFADILTNLPILKGKFLAEVERSRSVFKETLEVADTKFYKKMPEKGWKDKNILKRMNAFSQKELDMKENGQYSGSVFSTKTELMDLSKQVVSKFLYTNVLFYDMHPGSRQMEMEIIAMVMDMFDGIKTGACGLTSSGGSESILLSLLAHKRYYKKTKGITKPNAIFSETAHAAFYKACEFFDIEMIILPIDKETYTVHPDQFRKAINSNTICIVGSAPSVAYGNFDPLLAMD
jgi:sphinganine-1-phosphate aldolase